MYSIIKLTINNAIEKIFIYIYLYLYFLNVLNI